MKQLYNYDTVSEALNDLAKRGFTHDFNLHLEQECLICNNTMTQLSPDEFEIVETYRFEGETDPADEMVLFAISSIKSNLKGTLLNAFGIYAESSNSKIVEKLINNTTPIKPLKRAEFLKKMSREHHQGLLLCWKIKTGLSKGISAARIKVYTNWFFELHLLPHFEIEEKLLFPILGMHHPLIMKAMEEHKQLTALFKQTTEMETTLKQIIIDLDSHIRFEERVLFNRIQEVATPENIQAILNMDSADHFVDNTTDLFWN